VSPWIVGVLVGLRWSSNLKVRSFVGFCIRP
jgi:hypothetical protein